MARKKELTLVAARRPQLKRRAKRDWSNAKAGKFLKVRIPGRMDRYDRHAYSRLEMMLLDRAFNGTQKVVHVRLGRAAIWLRRSRRRAIRGERGRTREHARAKVI